MKLPSRQEHCLGGRHRDILLLDTGFGFGHASIGFSQRSDNSQRDSNSGGFVITHPQVRRHRHDMSFMPQGVPHGIVEKTRQNSAMNDPFKSLPRFAHPSFGANVAVFGDIRKMDMHSPIILLSTDKTAVLSPFVQCSSHLPLTLVLCGKQCLGAFLCLSPNVGFI